MFLVFSLVRITWLHQRYEMFYYISPILFSFLQVVSILCRVIHGCRDGVRLGRWPRKQWGLLRRFSLCTERPPEHMFWSPWRFWSLGKGWSLSRCPRPLEKEEEGPGDKCGNSPTWASPWISVTLCGYPAGALTLTSSLEDARPPLWGWWQPQWHQAHMDTHCGEGKEVLGLYSTLPEA